MHVRKFTDGYVRAYCGRSVRSAGRTAQVDVPDLGPGAGGLDVREQPQHPRHRAGHRDLGGAQQRHVGQPQQPGGVGRELGGEVRGRGEHDADQVGRVDAVAVQHLGDELGRALQDLVPVVRVDLDRARAPPAPPTPLPASSALRRPARLAARPLYLSSSAQPHYLRTHAQRARAGRRARRGSAGAACRPAARRAAPARSAVRTSRCTGMPDLGEQPADDVVAALVQHHLDDRLVARASARPGTVDPSRPVVELDPGAQPPPDVLAHRRRDGGEVGLASPRRTGASAGARARRRWSAAADPRCRRRAGRRGTAAPAGRRPGRRRSAGPRSSVIALSTPRGLFSAR